MSNRIQKVTLIAEIISAVAIVISLVFVGIQFRESSKATRSATANAAIGAIVIINCLEILYMRVTADLLDKFPYIKLRQRVEGRARLAELWRLHDCPGVKKPEFDELRIPRYFYRNLEPKE